MNKSMGSGAESEILIVTIRSKELENIEDITKRLEAAGMVIDSVLKTLGQVTGRAASSQVSSLQQIDEVESVSAQQSMRIAPPDSEIQ